MASPIERDIALDRPTVCTMCTVESTTERDPGRILTDCTV
jgi:hypothetical protein